MVCMFNRRTPRKLHDVGQNPRRASFYFLLLGSLLLSVQSFGWENLVPNIVTDPFKEVTDAVTDTANAAADTTSDAVNAAADTTSDAVNAAADTTSDAASAVADTASDTANTAGDVASDAANTAGDVASDAASAVEDAVEDIATDLFSKCSFDSQCADGEFCELPIEGTLLLGNCKERSDDNKPCAQYPWPSRDGVDGSCKSGNCVALLRISPTDNVAYCRPANGFGQGVPCTEDSDCSNEGSGLWCRGGGAMALGTCERCLDIYNCQGGCHACNNDESKMECGRSKDIEKVECAAEIFAEAAVDLIECLTGFPVECVTEGECLNARTSFEFEEKHQRSSSNATGGKGSGMGGNPKIKGNMQVDSTLNLSGNPGDWKYNAAFGATFEYNLELTLSEAIFDENTDKEQPLAKKRKVTQKVFILNGVPVLVELEVQPFLWFSKTKKEEFETTIKISGVIEGKLDLELDIDDATLSADGQWNAKDHVIESITQYSQSFGAVARAGPRFTISVNKVPMEIDVAARYGAEINAVASNGASIDQELVVKDRDCLSGSVKLNTGLDIRTGLGITLSNPFELAQFACGLATEVMLDAVENVEEKFECVGIPAIPITDLAEGVTSRMEEICKDAVELVTPEDTFSCVPGIDGRKLRGTRAAKGVLKGKSWSNFLNLETKINSGLCDDTDVEFLMETEVTATEFLNGCDADALIEKIFDDPPPEPNSESLEVLMGMEMLFP